MDFDSIPPGTDFREQIKAVIGQADVVVAIIGPHWLGERPNGSRRIDNPIDFVRLEIAYALKANIPVIPLLVDTTQMPTPETLPPEIQELAFRHALPLDSGVDFHSHTDRLIAGIPKAISTSRRSNRPPESLTPAFGVNTAVVRRIVIWSAIIVLAVTASAILLFAPQKRGENAKGTNQTLGPEQSTTQPVEPTSARIVMPSVPSAAASPTPNQSMPRLISTPSAIATIPPAEVLPERGSQSETGLLIVASITKEHPYVNSLNMRFVPVAGTNVLFSIWDTRVQDFEIFTTATQRSWSKPNFKQAATHAVTNVSWDDSKAFCVWLTQVERTAGRLSEKQKYRLPTDAEWSVAVGQKKYPWGNVWPPPHGAGNYGSSLQIDDYPFTSPVGMFVPNDAGLYDIGGNVWQWCEDWYRKDMNEQAVLDKLQGLKDDGGGRKQHVVRGASWYVSEPPYMLSSIRVGGGVPTYRNGNNGFRCVLVEGEGM